MQGLNLRESAPISMVLYGTVPLSIWGCWFFISVWSPVRGACRKVALIVSVKAVGFILSKWDENWWLKSFAMAWNRNSIFFLFSFLIPVTSMQVRHLKGAGGPPGWVADLTSAGLMCSTPGSGQRLAVASANSQDNRAVGGCLGKKIMGMSSGYSGDIMEYIAWHNQPYDFGWCLKIA